MFGLDLHVWEEIMVWSLGITAVAAFGVVVSTRVVTLLQRDAIREGSTALESYKADAGKAIAEAGKDAAIAKTETAKANERAEAAKAEAAKANARILEMQKMRRLEKKQTDALTHLFRSPLFQTDPKPGISLSAVSDAEARLFATELQNFFQSCGVDIYPTDGGLVKSCDQIAPDKFGLRLSVKSLDEPCLAHVEFQRVMIEIGLPLDVQSDPTLREKYAVLAVLMKPNNGDSVIEPFIPRVG